MRKWAIECETKDGTPPPNKENKDTMYIKTKRRKLEITKNKKDNTARRIQLTNFATLK